VVGWAGLIDATELSWWWV